MLVDWRHRSDCDGLTANQDGLLLAGAGDHVGWIINIRHEDLLGAKIVFFNIGHRNESIQADRSSKQNRKVVNNDSSKSAEAVGFLGIGSGNFEEDSISHHPAQYHKYCRNNPRKSSLFESLRYQDINGLDGLQSIAETIVTLQQSTPYCILLQYRQHPTQFSIHKSLGWQAEEAARGLKRVEVVGTTHQE